MKKHFVTFYSPGTFVSESTTKEVDSWDTEQAMKLVSNIKERHGATPYAFIFTTKSREENDLDSKETARSCVYHLGGKIETVEEIELRNDPKEAILLSNMQMNGMSRVVVNTNSWRFVSPLGDTDVVLDFKL